jgi:hypothetical protein
MVRLFVFIFLLSSTLQGSAHAEIARKLTWDQLVPVGQALDDPTIGLNPGQRFDLETILSVSEQRKRGLINDVDDDVELEVELRDKLGKEGLDVDELVRRYDTFLAELQIRNDMVDETLDGQLIKIPGYILPLEFDGVAVEEFLLVPYVGACIHVPAPPKNQMVMVRLKQSYAIMDMYEPVWITGRIKARGVTASVGVSDGKINVSTGYTMEDTQVEPYRE